MEVIPPHRIGHAMGINALVMMSASAVGPTIAGLLIEASSRRAVFGKASFAGAAGNSVLHRALHREPL